MKSRYFVAQDFYKIARTKENYANIKRTIYKYLAEGNMGIDAREIFILAKVELILENKVEAERLFKTIIKLEPKNVQARLELGKLYVSQGKEAEAETLFKEYMAIAPKNVHARLELGKLYVSQGKEKEAEKLFKEYMAIDPKNVHARLELGKLYVSQGKEAEAETLFKECMSINPDDVYARLELGRLYGKQGKRILSQYMDNSNNMPEQKECNQRNKEEIQKGDNEILLRKKDLTNALAQVLECFETITQEEKEDALRRFEYLKQMKPEEVTMEINDLAWYLMFKYKNSSVMEKFFEVEKDGTYTVLKSKTLIMPNDIKIKNGKVIEGDKSHIVAQVHKGDYYQELGEKIKEVDKQYVKRQEKSNRVFPEGPGED